MNTRTKASKAPTSCCSRSQDAGEGPAELEPAPESGANDAAVVGAPMRFELRPNVWTDSSIGVVE